MPVHAGEDRRGKYYQWGSQKKYYYATPIGKARAHEKAAAQGEAIRAAAARGKK